MQINMRTKEIEIWFLINESGDYWFGDDRDTPIENFDQNLDGGINLCKVRLHLPMPEVIELIVVPENI